VCGKRKLKIGLSKIGNNTTESVRHGQGNGLISFHGNKGTLVKVDGKAYGSRKLTKEVFQVSHILRMSLITIRIPSMYWRTGQ
jgi:hypothetical protein